MSFALCDQIRRLSSRHCLWWLLAIVLVIHTTVLFMLTQSTVEEVNVLLMWGGAIVLLQEQQPGRGPRPGRIQVLAGAFLLLAILWRSLQITGNDATSNLLTTLAGLSLALLAIPLRNLKPFAKTLLVFMLIPGMTIIANRLSTAELSLLTARVTQVLLLFCGLPVEVFGNIVKLPGGSVEIAGPCSGINILLQLIGIGVIFALAFPMRRYWQNGMMVIVAALLAVIANGIRIALLALITGSTFPSKDWWFDLFHKGEGSLVFSGVAVLAFVWLYTFWMKLQIAALESSR